VSAERAPAARAGLRELAARVLPFGACLLLVGLLAWDVARGGRSLADVPGAAALAAAEERVAEHAGGARVVTFDTLGGFDCPWTGPFGSTAEPPAIPDDVRALDGAVVALAGFAVPLVTDRGMMREFLLARHPADCCFGMLPQANELVHVVLAEGVDAVEVPLEPVIVVGRLAIRDLSTPEAQGRCLYSMVGERLE